MSCSISEIGTRIAALRGEREVSQDDLAKALNVSREVVAKWENGSRDLKTQYSVALADYFGVTCDELLRGIKPENIKINKELGLSNDSIEALKALNTESRNLLDERVVSTINLLIENEDEYNVIRKIALYLTKLSQPIHAIDILRTSSLEGQEVHIEATDEVTGLLFKFSYENLSNTFLIELQAQLLKLKESIEGKAVNDGKH